MGDHKASLVNQFNLFTHARKAKNPFAVLMPNTDFARLVAQRVIPDLEQGTVSGFTNHIRSENAGTSVRFTLRHCDGLVSDNVHARITEVHH